MTPAKNYLLLNVYSFSRIHVVKVLRVNIIFSVILHMSVLKPQTSSIIIFCHLCFGRKLFQFSLPFVCLYDYVNVLTSDVNYRFNLNKYLTVENPENSIYI